MTLTHPKPGFQGHPKVNKYVYFFTNRALDVWNSLPKHVVFLSDTFNTFKSKIDKF